MLSISDFSKILSLLRDSKTDKRNRAIALANYVDAIADDCDALTARWDEVLDEIAKTPSAYVIPVMVNKKSYSSLRTVYNRVHATLSAEQNLADRLHSMVAATLQNRELLYQRLMAKPSLPDAKLGKLAELLAMNAAEMRHLAHEVRLSKG